MNIKYPDNSMLTVHQDNTRIFTFSDQLKYLVEHESKKLIQIIKKKSNKI